MSPDSVRSPGYPAQELRGLILRWGHQVYGALLGLITGPLLLLGLLVRRRCPGFAARTLQWERRRLDKHFRIRTDILEPLSATGQRGLANSSGYEEREKPQELHMPGPVYVLLSAVVAGIFGMSVLSLLNVVVVQTLGTFQLVLSGPGTTVTINFTTWEVSPPIVLVGLFYVLGSVAAVCITTEFAAWLSAKVAAIEFTVERRDELRARIAQLVTTRRGVVEMIDDERRRIERDLHDGAQQNLVSLSMLIARAQRSQEPGQAQQLLDLALTQSQDLMQEMREVAWRIYPAALDELGLQRALTSMAETSAMEVTLDSQIPRRPAQHVESAAFFVVREALTNALKHSGASAAFITVEPLEVPKQVNGLRVTVHDEGDGGADPRGSGLRGLARRVEALDGTFTVTSPPGGPTTITAELPYE